MGIRPPGTDGYRWVVRERACAGADTWVLRGPEHRAEVGPQAPGKATHGHNTRVKKQQGPVCHKEQEVGWADRHCFLH